MPGFFRHGGRRGNVAVIVRRARNLRARRVGGGNGLLLVQPEIHRIQSVRILRYKSPVSRCRTVQRFPARGGVQPYARSSGYLRNLGNGFDVRSERGSVTDFEYVTVTVDVLPGIRNLFFDDRYAELCRALLRPRTVGSGNHIGHFEHFDRIVYADR